MILGQELHGTRDTTVGKSGIATSSGRAMPCHGDNTLLNLERRGIFQGEMPAYGATMYTWNQESVSGKLPGNRMVHQAYERIMHNRPQADLRT